MAMQVPMAPQRTLNLPPRHTGAPVGRVAQANARAGGEDAQQKPRRKKGSDGKGRWEWGIVAETGKEPYIRVHDSDETLRFAYRQVRCRGPDRIVFVGDKVTFTRKGKKSPGRTSQVVLWTDVQRLKEASIAAGVATNIDDAEDPPPLLQDSPASSSPPLLSSSPSGSPLPPLEEGEGPDSPWIGPPALESPAASDEE
eukprot:Hpha_TRINITY_DN15672_c0_g1::TRINITY_DN15672_c0_g1_i1::g.101830::m.101830